MKPTKFPNLWERGKYLYTQNLTPGKTFFEEDTIKFEGKEFRYLDPKRSKLAAAVLKGISQIGIKEGDTVLYLGASHGYTASYISDMVRNGFIFAVDFAPRVVRDLVFLCEQRKNIAPILADAGNPDSYRWRMHKVDVLYMDVAQRDQAEIFLKNCSLLKKGGFGLLAVKSRSIDMSRRPKQIYQEVRKKLEAQVTVVDFRVLDPLEKDHCMFVVKK